jgi:hypothetical protein
MKKVVEKKGKKKVGRPPAFTNDEELQASLFLYLNECVSKKKMPNKAGYCFFAKISRDSYYEYKKNSLYSDTIKQFEQAVESEWVNRLSGSSATGAIFYLKNAFRDHYKDRIETDITSKGEQIHIYIPERK